MRKKLTISDYTRMQLFGPIFKKKIDFISESLKGGKKITDEIYFYIREDGALIYSSSPVANDWDYAKMNRYVFKFKTGLKLHGDFFKETPIRCKNIVLKRKKTSDGLVILGEIYRYTGRIFTHKDYLVEEFEFLTAFEVKLIRAAKNSYLKKLKKMEEKNGTEN